MGIHVSGEDKKMYVTGVRDIPTKSASDTLDIFKEIMGDISEVSGKLDFGDKLLSEIQNSMSDRASTEEKFHELLMGLKEKILPKVHDKWYTFSEEQQKKLINTQQFYCGLHSYVQMAEVADAALLHLEEEVGEHLLTDSDPPAHGNSEYSKWKEEGLGGNDCRLKNAKESGPVRTIQTVSKLFASGAHAKNGVSGDCMKW